MSLPILSGTVEIPKLLEDEEATRNKLSTKLEEEGFKFSIEGEQIKYEDFFNEANISTRNNGQTGEVIYSISITAKCITTTVISILLALIPGVILVTVWYLKYSKLKNSIESTLGSIS